MNQKMKVKVIGTIGLLFILLCAAKVVKTYEKDPEEAVFEGFLLASIAAYHGATLYSLKQKAQEDTERKIQNSEPLVEAETINMQVETISDRAA